MLSFFNRIFFFIHALGKYSLTVSCVTAWRGLLSSGEGETLKGRKHGLAVVKVRTFPGGK